MKILTALFLLCFTFGCMDAYAGFQGRNQGANLSPKLYNIIDCGEGLTCSRASSRGEMEIQMDFTGDGSEALVGYKTNQVAATATTITVAQCGSSFINSGAVQMELPEASVALGCRLTFITGNASNFDVNPDDADQILVETNAVGDAIRNAVLGESITLEAISASQWAVVAINGTYADID